MSTSRDIHNSMIVTSAIAPVADAGTTSGAIIDTNEADSLEFVGVLANLAGGTFDLSIEQGDDPTLADVTTANVNDVLGAGDIVADGTPGPGVISLDADGEFKIGYVGDKRYVRVVLTEVGGATGDLAALSVQEHLHRSPAA